MVIYVEKKVNKDIVNFIFINVYGKDRNMSFSSEMEAIFIKTTYLNQSLYYKVINAFNMRCVSIFYLNRTDNIELTI